MLDTEFNKFFKPILVKISYTLIKHQLSPNQITLFGLIIGFSCFIFLSLGMINTALFLFLFNRILDGIDGTMARLTKPSDLGGVYDIISDFFVYALLPFGFILFDEKNFLSMSLLLTSFILTCSTFLTTAWIYEKNKIQIDQISKKSFYYSVGLIEGTETIVLFVLMFIFNEVANYIAWFFSALCFITALIRVIQVSKILNS